MLLLKSREWFELKTLCYLFKELFLLDNSLAGYFVFTTCWIALTVFTGVAMMLSACDRNL